MDGLIQDFRYALRNLRRTPGATAAAILCLGLGIGVNAVMLSAVDSLLFAPPAHVQQADELVRVHLTRHPRNRAPFTDGTLTLPWFEGLRNGSRGMADMAAYYRRAAVTFGRGPEARSVTIAAVTGSFFPLLGVNPVRGRLIVMADDDIAKGSDVAVISESFWRSALGADTGIVGRMVRVGGRHYAVAGIAPRGFTGVELENVDVWLPVNRSYQWIHGPDVVLDGTFWLRVVGRLRPGWAAERAEQDLTPVARDVLARGEFNDSLVTAVLTPVQRGRGVAMPAEVRVSLWAAGVAFVVLLIASANVANLLLTRAVKRRRELAVSAALGAGRWRLASQLAAEGLLLAGAGCALALVLTYWLIPATGVFLIADSPLRQAFTLRLLALVLSAAALTGILAAILPALSGSRPDLTVDLKSGRHGGARQLTRTRNTLLVGQVALTLALVCGAGLFARSLQRAYAKYLGIDSNVLIATIDLKGDGYSRTEINGIFDEMAERLRGVAGVTSAAHTAGYPFGTGHGGGIRARDREVARVPTTWFQVVSRDYFSAAGQTIVSGRGFLPADRAGSMPVVVINQTAAEIMWKGASPLGQCVDVGGEICREVVGIVRDGPQFSLTEDPPMRYYVPVGQDENETSAQALFVRTIGAPQTLLSSVQAAMLSVRPGLPFATVRPWAEVSYRQYRPWRMGVVMFGAFGLLALVLAAVGLYGLLSYLVGQRTYELGVRQALGADAGDLRRLVIGYGLRLTSIGLVIGVIGAILAGRALSSLLYGVSGTDAFVLAGGVSILLGVAFVASYLPARRATKVDPMMALRAE